MTEAEWLKEIKVHEAAQVDKDVHNWQEWVYDNTPETVKPTARPTPAPAAQAVTNNITINFTYAVQNVIVSSGSERPLSITNVIETAMDVTARRLASPMTARDQALLKEQAGYMAGYR